MTKPKILFLTVHRPGRSPSQRFRFEQYLPFLSSQGIEWHFSYLLNEKEDKIFYSYGKIFSKAGIVLKSAFKRWKELRQIRQYDGVFIQRESFMLGTSFFERHIKKAGVKLIFDFDDAIWLPSVSPANKAFSWLKSPRKVPEILSLADKVIAGNAYLAAYARTYNPNTTIIPTTIDTEYHVPKPTPPRNQVILGWTGSASTNAYLQEFLPVLSRLKEKYPSHVSFYMISDRPLSVPAPFLHFIPWKKETEIKDLYRFDIGIMPLPDTPWTRGKCGLKGLQYMALEIPTVMSPVGVNTEIIQDGENGFLAATEEEWIEKLSLLIESPQLREKLGKAGRKTVVEKYSVEANKHKYLQVFQEVLGIYPAS
ncbi:MAG: glycosyltransferase family 4 protein [Bacteroidia bacterium]